MFGSTCKKLQMKQKNYSHVCLNQDNEFIYRAVTALCRSLLAQHIPAWLSTIFWDQIIK